MGESVLPLNSFLLFFHHVCQLLKNGAQLNDCRLDVLHGICPALDVGILHKREHHELGPGFLRSFHHDTLQTLWGTQKTEELILLISEPGYLLVNELKLLACSRIHHVDGHIPGGSGLCSQNYGSSP